MKDKLLTEAYYLTDGGLETTLIFHDGIELNHFAAFELLNNEKGSAALKRYYQEYIRISRKYGLGFILETPTWRSNADWGRLLGYSSSDLDLINRSAVHFMQELRKAMDPGQHAMISGCIGPRGDGYIAEQCMSAAEAKDYHSEQVKSFAQAGADMVSAMTLNYSEEAVGVVMAARELGIPVVISFTVETDGKLPNGEQLSDAIEKTDALTGSFASYFMINCAHPAHFEGILKPGTAWISRIRGIRANASMKSHAELNESATLDTGDKPALALGYMELRKLLPNLAIVGGCCGTDHTHMEAICGGMFAGEA